MVPSLRHIWPRLAALLVVAAGCVSSHGAAKMERFSPTRGSLSPVTAPRVAALRNEPDRAGTPLVAKGTPAHPESAKSMLPLRDAPEKPAEEASAMPLPRITSVALFTYIYERPARYKAPLGYVHVGSSVALRKFERVRRPGCAAAWYPVE